MPSRSLTGQDGTGPKPSRYLATSAFCTCRAGLDPLGNVRARLCASTPAIAVLDTCRTAWTFFAGAPKAIASIPSRAGAKVRWRGRWHYSGCPAAHRSQLHLINPIERLNGEIRRRTGVAGPWAFPWTFGSHALDSQ